MAGHTPYATAQFSLLGTWRSNAELTIESIKSTRQLSEEGEAANYRMFGNLELTFDPEIVTVDLGTPGAQVFSSLYKIAESDSEQIVVEFSDLDGKLKETAHYLWENGCIKRQMSKGGFEYLCRVE